MKKSKLSESPMRRQVEQDTAESLGSHRRQWRVIGECRKPDCVRNSSAAEMLRTLRRVPTELVAVLRRRTPSYMKCRHGRVVSRVGPATAKSHGSHPKAFPVSALQPFRWPRPRHSEVTLQGCQLDDATCGTAER